MNVYDFATQMGFGDDAADELKVQSLRQQHCG
jgi:hypothetical protein